MTFILVQVLLFLAVYLLFRPVGRRTDGHDEPTRPFARRANRADHDERRLRVVTGRQVEVNRATADHQARTHQAVANVQTRTAREIARQEERVVGVEAQTRRIREDEADRSDWW